MKSNVWLRFVWMDYQLQWDEADYGGIGVLRLPPDKVWKPDIVLFNKYAHEISNIFFFFFTNKINLCRQFLYSLDLQRRWQLRGSLQKQRANISERRSALGATSDLSKLVHNRRHILPFRSTDVCYEVRLVDIQRRSSLSRALQRQELRRFVRLLEERHVGHHSSAGVSQYL